MVNVILRGRVRTFVALLACLAMSAAVQAVDDARDLPFVDGALGLQAQGGDGQPTVSREVMTLLMSGPGMTSGQFEMRVGTAPNTFPVELLPPGTTIEASAIASGAVTVVGANGSLSASDLFTQLPRLTAAGWSHTGPPGRGFLSGPANMPLTVCRNQEFAVISFAAREAGGVYARVTIRQEPRQTCGARPDFNFPDVTFPVLVAPPGATIAGSGSGGGLDDMQSRARLITSATLRDVTTHYVSQIERAGWTVTSRDVSGDDLTVTRFAVPSRLGDAITAVLLLTRLGTENHVSLLLHVVRNQPSQMPPAAGPRFIDGGLTTLPGVTIRQQ